jgi:hypothetical protein
MTLPTFKRTCLVAGVVLLELASAGCRRKSEAPKVTPEQLTEVGKIFAAADASSAATETAFHAALDNLDAVTAGTSPCAASFNLDDDPHVADELAVQLQTARIAHSTVRAGTATITADRSKLSTLTSASLEVRHREERRLQDREDEYSALGGAALIARAHQLATRSLPNELLILITGGADPTLIDHDHFNGGIALARAYLFSPTERRFVCAGKVSAESSKVVNTFLGDADPGSDSNPDVTADLYLNLISEAQHSLHATP